MDLKITKEYPAYTKCGDNSRLCVVVTFPNCFSSSTLKPFKWMPTYQQLHDIKEALFEIEEISWKQIKK